MRDQIYWRRHLENFQCHNMVLKHKNLTLHAVEQLVPLKQKSIISWCTYFQNFQIGDDYCGQHEFNTPIVGTEAVSTNATLYIPDTVARSIAVMVTHEYTVAFVGTAEGQLKKVRWSLTDMKMIIGITWRGVSIKKVRWSLTDMKMIIGINRRRVSIKRVRWSLTDMKMIIGINWRRVSIKKVRRSLTDIKIIIGIKWRGVSIKKVIILII